MWWCRFRLGLCFHGIVLFATFQPFLAEDPLLAFILVADVGSAQEQDLPTTCDGSGAVLVWEANAETSQIYIYIFVCVCKTSPYCCFNQIKQTQVAVPHWGRGGTSGNVPFFLAAPCFVLTFKQRRGLHRPTGYPIGRVTYG